MTKDEALTLTLALEAGVEVTYDPTETPLRAFAECWIEDLERFAELVRADEREAILPMLKGIDQTECENSEGWWETSTGAAFGAGILAAIRARGNT